jgi:hypothetical protein
MPSEGAEVAIFMEKLAESRRLRTRIVALLWLFMAGSALLMYWAWNTDSYTWRVAVGFTFFAEISLVPTCFALLRRFAANRPVSAAFILTSLFLWEIVPGGLLLLPFTLFYPIAAVPILVTIFLAIWARYLIAREKILPGVLISVIPIAFVVAVCFYRPWSVTSEIWPVVGAAHSVLLLMVLCIAMFQIEHSRRGRYPEAQERRISEA